MDGQGGTQPFSFREAVQRAFRYSSRSDMAFLKSRAKVLEDPLLKVLKECFADIYQLCIHSGTRLVILEKQSGYCCKLLVDTRNILELELKNLVIYWVVDKETNVLLLETQDVTKVPRNNSNANRFKPSEVLSLFKDGIEPQTLDCLKATLERYGIANETLVSYQVCSRPLVVYPWFEGSPQFETPKHSVVAFARTDLSLGYRIDVQRKLKWMKPDVMPSWMEELYRGDLPTLENANRRSSVSVKLKGLALARCLNIITLDEMKRMSHALSKTSGAVWLTCDEEKHIRHIVYSDAMSRPFKAEFKCKGDLVCNDSEWNKFFERVEKAGAIMQSQKCAILQPLLTRLEKFEHPEFSSPWKRCYEQLKLLTRKHQIFTFCDDDHFLHCLKGPLAGWGSTKVPKKKFANGVFLHTLANYTISAISNPLFFFVNLSNYFNYRLSVFKPYEDDLVLYELAHQWLSDQEGAWNSPQLRHRVATLDGHRPVNGSTARSNLMQRGIRNAQTVSKLWTALTKHYVEHFGCDITSVHHFSLSQMAFTIVWNKYREEAGPMCHSIEMMHPHTEFMLRPYCKGGFSYSCEDKVVQGELLESSSEEVASSIAELDLTSSYGFSGKSMSSASGFGVIFTPESGRKGQRHVSFEYMATMYTIYKWTRTRQVLSVFSNFSPLGTLQIGKFPIDLAVVFLDGTVELMQFDGHFVHGDYNNPKCSKSIKNLTYVEGQSRSQVEEKTRARDEALLNWMIQVSHENMKYSVITDCCHTEEYSRRSLKSAFRTIPELKKLVEGMDNLDGTLDCVDLNEFTFLAIAEGSCRKSTEGNRLGPVFTADQRQPTRDSGKMLLTSDYYAYLKQNFDFQVTSVEWVVYYKRCRALNQVFSNLLQLRQDTADVKSKSAIVKSIINYSCGYFGLNSDKALKTVARISHRAPQNYNEHLHTLEPIDEIYNNASLVLVKTLRKPPTKRFMCSTPFALFVSIVEFGKLRLNQALLCLQKYLRPSAFRLLYSNVDNMIVALSTDNFCQALRQPDLLPEFEREWSFFSGPEPGQLKLEWEMLADSKWKFVSPMRMFYSVVATNQDSQGHSKTCALKNLGTEQSFDLGMKFLNQERVRVEQIRRVDKLASTAVKPVVYNY